MRKWTFLLAAVGLGACAAQQTEPEAAADPPAEIGPAAVAPAPTPLPALSPASRRQRDIEGMSAADFARWVLPAEAGLFAKLELTPSRWGQLGYAILWQAPRAAGPAATCEISGTGIWLQVVDENKLGDQERLNPPLRPYQISPERRWKVIGRTVGGSRPSAAECDAAAPHSQWPAGPSAAGLFEAANLLEQAQLQAQAKRARYAYRCTQWHYPEGAETSVERPCATGTIQKFTPLRMRSAKQVQCIGLLAAARRGRCWELDYELREGEGFFYYTVRVGGAGRPEAVWIAQYVPPPH